MDFLHYGLQRSGTNFLKGVMLKNFRKVAFHNGEVRNLTTHKHFRLYDDKQYVPEHKYHNDLIFNSFSEFDPVASRDAGVAKPSYLVIVKNPYSWYLSITKMAKSLDWESYDKDAGFQAHYIHDWNRYYGKWKSFAGEQPDRVFFLTYEDLLAETDQVLSTIQSHFSLQRKKDLRHLFFGKKGKFFNVGRVPNSKNWGEDRKKFYMNKEFYSKLSAAEKQGIDQTLDSGLMGRIGYEMG